VRGRTRHTNDTPTVTQKGGESKGGGKGEGKKGGIRRADGPRWAVADFPYEIPRPNELWVGGNLPHYPL
jgi:hypothetical protein